jgi:acetylornithine deacetylase/succinyl-diaminopimelate desuccinylase-like protein
LYGRGSADDKAGIAVHLAALRTLMEPDAEPLSLGIVVFIEGEEENGSPSFAGFLNEFQELLHGTIIVVADSDNPAPDLPAITTSLRGNVTAVLRIRTLDHALHSGMFGGAVPDALMAFARLASSVYDDHGGVAVAGLTSTVAGGFGPVGLAPPEAGLLPGVTEIGHGSLKDRLWQNAAITVTGLDVPSVPEASNTLVPEVRAKISLRVPPGMSASQALEALTSHLELHIPWGALWSLEDVTTGESFVVEESHRAVVLAGHALEAGFGNPVVHQGVGGSIPFISQLSQQFPDAHIVVTGVEDPDTRAHSPNESLNLGVLWRQALSESIFLALVNRRGHSDFVGETGVE